jgi:hypothetical protein
MPGVDIDGVPANPTLLVEVDDFTLLTRQPFKKIPFQIWAPIVAAIIGAVATLAAAYIGLGDKVNNNSLRLDALKVLEA